MGALPHVADEQRRARLVTRHAITAPHRVGSPAEAAAAVVALHATEPASVHLAVHARAEVTLDDVDAALYDDRTIVKQLAMRRTVWAVPRALLAATRASAAARVAAQQRTHLARDLVKHGVVDGTEADALALVDTTVAAVHAHLDRHGPTTTADLRAVLPALDARIPTPYGPTGSLPLAPRYLTVAAAAGAIVRGTNAGSWRSSRPRWTLAAEWLGPPDEPDPSAAEGYRALVGAWLARFGPGTEDDLVWWLGATRAAVRAALADLGAVAVTLDAHPGQPEAATRGWLLASDLDPVDPPEPGAALLPVLDPTTMGWTHRAFYLHPHREEVFDRGGNAGTTAWWDGRVVGGWVQRPDGSVQVALLHDVGAEAAAALDREADRLARFLDGEVVGTVYPSPLMRRQRASTSE